MKRSLLLIILLSVILPVFAQQQRDLFADESYQARKDYGERLNKSGLYMDAYLYLEELHQHMLETIADKGLTPAMLPNTSDFVFYQNILIDEAECAYMLNLWKEMYQLSYEHSNAINERYEAGLGRNADYYWQVGAFYKVYGDACYLRSASDNAYYDLAQERYDSALEFFDLAGDNHAKAKVYAELAQLNYVQKNYYDALDYIELAIANNIPRRASGSNAKESFSDQETQNLNLTYQSAYAMCEAQVSGYRSAKRIIDDLIDQLPKNDKRLPELKRRKAKILLLSDPSSQEAREKASALYEEYFKAVKDTVARNFLQLTAEQRESYWMQQRQFVVDCCELEDTNPSLLYDVALFNKGILLQTSRSFEDLLYDGTRKNKPNEKQNLMKCRMKDAEDALAGKQSNTAEVYERELLKQMTLDGRRKKFFDPLSYTWKDVQKALPQNGCAIEFVQYEKEDVQHLGALVLKKKGQPQFVEIVKVNNFLNFDISWFTSVGEILKNNNVSYMDELYDQEWLADAIWTYELVDAIGDSRKIYFSPDGVFHIMPIEYILPESMTDKDFYRLSSTRVLVDGKSPNTKSLKGKPAFVIGGMNYELLFPEDYEQVRGNDASAFQLLQSKYPTFRFLNAAVKECDSIIAYRNNPEDVYLHHYSATEQAFYDKCSKFPIIHFSTHGGFINNTYTRSELMPTASKDMLSYSSLLLAGAQTNLYNPNFDAFCQDGILSAREVARLNLSNVELLTTSACQTGIGVITADGVYGLQRGFKSAGVKGMMMTLWSVYEEPARIFFTRFYQRLQNGESICKAFKQSRQDLIYESFTTTTTRQGFSPATLSTATETVTITSKYNTPRHTYPYILIDVWE